MTATATLYIVVYGNEWEDIMYFSDFQKAKRKLLIQTHAYDKDERDKFYPCLYELKEDNGVYKRTKNCYIVDAVQFNSAFKDKPIECIRDIQPDIIDRLVINALV